MDRLLLGATATLYQAITVAEAPTDPTPDTATVTIVRSDGSLVADAAVADDEGVGAYSITVPGTDVDRLDSWTIEWTVVLGGTTQVLTSHAEVVGGYLFALSELRGMDPLADEIRYPLSELLEKRTLAETMLEDACGRAFVPRYRTERRRMHNGRVFTSAPDVRAVRSFSTSTPTSWTASPTDLAGLTVDADSFGFTSRWGSSRWGRCGDGRVIVGYEHGMDYPPADVKRAALQLARYFLVEGPTDPRVITQTGDFGSSTLWTPGVRGAVTPLPEVDAVIRRYALPAAA